jgi:hypothetical protein
LITDCDDLSHGSDHSMEQFGVEEWPHTYVPRGT